MDGNYRRVCNRVLSLSPNNGDSWIMKHAEIICNKGVKVMYSENGKGNITIIKGKRIIDRFDTGILEIDEVFAIGGVIKNIVDKWYLHGILLERRLEEVRYLPIY